MDSEVLLRPSPGVADGEEPLTAGVSSLLGPVAERLATELAVVDHRGVILEVNAAWRRFGQDNRLQTPGWGVGLNYLSICREASGPTAKAANDIADGLAAVLSGERATFYREYPCHSPEERRWFSVRITPLKWPGGCGAVIAHDPITGRLLAEEELLRLQSRYRHLIDMVGDAVLVIGIDLGFLNANAEACERYGHGREAWAGLNLKDVVAPSQRSLVEARVQRILHLGRNVHRTEHLAADGRVMPTEVNSLLIEYEGQPAILAVCRDLSDRQQLDTSQQRLAAALDAIDEGLLLTDAQGVVTHVNRGLERMTGFPREELVGHLPSLIAGESGPSALFLEIGAALRERGIWVGQVDLRRRDGAPYEVRATVVPVVDESGTLVESLTVLTDITAELALQRQAARSEVIELVGRLTESVAHDFHNLLLEIEGYAELAASEFDDPAQLAADLQAVRDAAGRGARLVSRLVAFGSQAARGAKPCDLQELLRDLEPLLHPMLGEDVELAIDRAEAAPAIRADFGAVQQMVVHLALLAREMMPQGGWVGVAAKRVRAAAPGQGEREWLRLTVSDTGSGLTPEVRERLFDGQARPGDGRIRRLAARPTIQSMVEFLGGWISADTRPGIGSAVHLYFALADDEEAADGPLVAERSEACGDERVLVIEDDRTLRATMARVLRDCGYDVQAAADGPEALGLVESWTSPPALLVTDVMLPGASGVEVVEWLRDRWPEQVVLYVSGYSEGRLALDNLREGDRFLPKPFGFASLQRQVREMLDGAAKETDGVDG